MGQRYRVISYGSQIDIIDHQEIGTTAEKVAVSIYKSNADLAESLCFFMNELHYEKKKSG